MSAACWPSSKEPVYYATGDPALVLSYWQKDGNYLLTVINTSYSASKQVSFTLPAGFAGTSQSLFARMSNSLTLSGNSVTGTLQPQEVQVYQITPGSTPTPAPGFGGTYRLLARHSGKALDIYGAGLDDGAPAIQWAYGGGANQQWKIEQVDPAARLGSPAAAGLAGPETAAALSLYPNPSPDGKATLRLRAAKAQSATVFVRNPQGGLVGVFTVPVPAGATDWRLPSTLPKGTYFVQTTLDGKPQRFTLSVE